MKKWLVVLFIGVGGVLGCASEEKTWLMPYGDEGSRAPAAAYAADGFFPRKPMPHRPNPPQWEFFYKHCAMNGESTYFTKDSYDCSGPAY